MRVMQALTHDRGNKGAQIGTGVARLMLFVIGQRSLDGVVFSGQCVDPLLVPRMCQPRSIGLGLSVALGGRVQQGEDNKKQKRSTSSKRGIRVVYPDGKKWVSVHSDFLLCGMGKTSMERNSSCVVNVGKELLVLHCLRGKCSLSLPCSTLRESYLGLQHSAKPPLSALMAALARTGGVS